MCHHEQEKRKRQNELHTDDVHNVTMVRTLVFSRVAASTRRGFSQVVADLGDMSRVAQRVVTRRQLSQHSGNQTMPALTEGQKNSGFYIKSQRIIR